jgi:hypothetical protein
MLDNADKQVGGNVAAECPAVVPVADDVTEVGDRGEHGHAPEILVWDVDGRAVDAEVHAAEEAHLQARGCDDDVCVEGVAGGELDAVGSDGFDGVGYDGCAAAVEAAEVVAVGAEAEALGPGVVARLEVWVDGEVGGELALGFGAEEVGRARGEVDAEVVEDDGEEGVLEA